MMTEPTQQRHWLSSLPWHTAPWSRIVMGGLWFFLIMVAYYVLKALRDAVASPQADVLNRLYLATFTVTLIASTIYSFVISHTTRGRLVFWTTQFFVTCLLFFLFWMDLKDLTGFQTAVLFVWVSVFNLFVVAIFWSVMADSFSVDEGKLWFGVIAASGSTGSIVGSYVAKLIAKSPSALLITSMFCLELTLILAWLLMRRAHNEESKTTKQEDNVAIGGSLWQGWKHILASPYLGLLCIYVVMGKFAATFIYNNLQLVLKQQMPLLEDRLSLFATMNLWTQGGSLLLQGVVAGVMMRYLGVASALATPALTLAILFSWLGFDSSLMVFAVAQVTQQIVGYGLMTPAQHVLFTVVPRQDKYQSKGFIDTVVFRFSDVAAGNVVKGMEQLHWTLSTLSMGMLPLMICWFGIAIYLGRQYWKRSGEARASR